MFSKVLLRITIYKKLNNLLLMKKAYTLIKLKKFVKNKKIYYPYFYNRKK